MGTSGDGIAARPVRHYLPVANHTVTPSGTFADISHT
jgi:hypothetical protein